MSVLDELLEDLAAEGDLLRAAVADLTPGEWRTPTPAEGWEIATQIAHLAWTDETAIASAATTWGDRDAWATLIDRALDDPEGLVDAEALAGARAEPDALLARWDTARAALPEALRKVPAGGRLPWFGPPMSPASMATARFMETWAHALDVYDALGLAPEPTDRVRHVCHLGVRTREFAYVVHDLPLPGTELRVELTAPGGAVWAWGPEDATQRVTGPAWDFARLVTQRIHRDDTALVAAGADADRWLGIAQAFAGPSGKGREARG